MENQGLVIDGSIYSQKDILSMNEQQLKGLIAQCDTVGKLRLLQSWTTNQKIVVYIDNLIWKL